MMVPRHVLCQDRHGVAAGGGIEYKSSIMELSKRTFRRDSGVISYTEVTNLEGPTVAVWSQLSDKTRQRRASGPPSTCFEPADYVISVVGSRFGNPTLWLRTIRLGLSLLRLRRHASRSKATSAYAGAQNNAAEAQIWSHRRG